MTARVLRVETAGGHRYELPDGTDVPCATCKEARLAREALTRTRRTSITLPPAEEVCALHPDAIDPYRRLCERCERDKRDALEAAAAAENLDGLEVTA